MTRATANSNRSGSNRSGMHTALRTTVMLFVPLSFSPLITLSASAQVIVFDPSNFSENVLTAARELQQVDNEIQSLTNQAQMLVNQGRNLASLPMSTLQQLESSVQQTEDLLSQAQNISFDVQQIETAFTSTYGSIPATASDASLISVAQTRWQNSVDGLEDSLKVQAGVVGNIPADSSAMSSLVSASQSATGALQAAQAGNQLLALQSQQLSDLVAVVAAKGRADALQQAEDATTEAQGQAQYQHFSAQSGYVPHDITMFNN